jgi:hypothetical protein
MKIIINESNVNINGVINGVMSNGINNGINEISMAKYVMAISSNNENINNGVNQ